MRELLQDVAAWATKQPGSDDDDDDDGVGCWSAVRISQLDIDGQKCFLSAPVCPSLRGARKESTSPCCFSSSAAEGHRLYFVPNATRCALAYAAGLSSEFWLKASHFVVLPFLPRLLSLQSRQTSGFSFTFLQQSPVLGAPLNI